MHILIFTDLDDTLFQSARRAPPQTDWQPLAFLKGGEPICWGSPKQLAFMQWLRAGGAQLVPVTARNLDAFSRVTIDRDGLAVIDFGAVILEADGQPDETWLAQSKEKAHASAPALQQWLDFLQWVNAAMNADVSARLVGDFGALFYVAAKSATHRTDWVQTLAVHCREALRAGALPPMVLHCNGNNLALLPPWLDKSHAVRYILARCKNECGEEEKVLSIGLGDSLTDVPFLRTCDWRMMPGGSQIDAALLRVVERGEGCDE